jgi:hypothetical protein
LCPRLRRHDEQREQEGQAKAHTEWYAVNPRVVNVKKPS